MSRFFSLTLPLLFLLLSTPVVQAQSQSESASTFDPEAAWDPSFLKASADRYRTGSGHPGPEFWQNHVDYTIEAELDTSTQRIRGTVEFTYTNNSPTPLHSIWLHVSTPGMAKRGSKAASRRFDIRSVTAPSEEKPSTRLTDTRLQIQLTQPVPSGGGTTTLQIKYTLPLAAEGLPSRGFTPDGVIYEVAHWFPRVAVYDHRRGWGHSPFLTSKNLHGEYGSFDYRITVPASMIVAGSGTLMNPSQVLTSDQKRRLLRARNSSGKVSIISPDQAGTPSTRPKQSGQLTWHFRMNGVREVAWVASPSFVWNGIQIQRPDKRPALAMSFYPRSSVGGKAWNRSTYHARQTVKYYSETYYTYPWNTVINVAGASDNFGFPGLSICDHSSTGYGLFACTAQTQAKNWFPAMVSPNSNRHPWLVEGLGTYISILAHRTLYDGEFQPKRDDHYAPDGGNPSEEVLPILTSAEAAPIMIPPDFLPSEWHTRLYSFKTAFGFTLLRQYILGPNRFDYALRQFVDRWTFKSPTPSDFFRAMNDATGENLSWFWKGWFAKTWTIDQSVANVQYVNDNPEEGARITLKLLRKLPMPVELKIIESDGNERRVQRPVEIWQQGATQTIRVSTDSRITKVVLDPDNKLPDVNASNDTWNSEKL